MPHVSKIQTGKASKDYGTGRSCAYPGCKHLLSRYNPDDVCGHHTSKISSLASLEVEQEFKRCSNCGELKPATREFYRRRKDSFEAQCKSCVNMKRRARKDFQLEAEGKRRCSVCNKVKALTAYNWKLDIADDSGLSTVCTDCIREKSRIANRGSRQRKVLRDEG